MVEIDPWDPNNGPIQAETDLYRKIWALRDDPDLRFIVEDALRVIEGEKTDVTKGRVNGFIRRAKRMAKNGLLG